MSSQTKKFLFIWIAAHATVYLVNAVIGFDLQWGEPKLVDVASGRYGLQYDYSDVVYFQSDDHGFWPFDGFYHTYYHNQETGTYHTLCSHHVKPFQGYGLEELVVYIIIGFAFVIGKILWGSKAPD